MTRKLCILFLIAAFCLSLSVCVSAAGENDPENLLIDEADLLDPAQERSLEALLAEISHTYQVQISVYTYPAVEEIELFAWDVYWSTSRGYGDDEDGVLLMISMDPRNYAMITHGLADYAIYDGLAEDMEAQLVADLQAEDYYGAFSNFAQSCGNAFLDYQTVDIFEIGFYLVVSLAIGLAVGLIVVLILKGQLKSVRMQRQANAYMKPGSMRLTAHSDLFLYRNVVRTKKPTNNSSGGGGRSGGGTVRSGSF